MAIQGSCVSTKERVGNILTCKWVLTANGDGDCSQNDIGNTVSGAPFYLSPIYGWVVGVEIQYTDATTGYDVYVKDGNGIDILKGLGVGLINNATDAGNRFCPMNTSQELKATAGVYAGMPILLWNATLEAIGDDMGDSKITTIVLSITLPADHNM